MDKTGGAGSWPDGSSRSSPRWLWLLPAVALNGCLATAPWVAIQPASGQERRRQSVSSTVQTSLAETASQTASGVPPASPQGSRQPDESRAGEVVSEAGSTTPAMQQDHHGERTLPVISSDAGFSLTRELRLPSWAAVTLSALSQNNGTIDGLSPAQATSSNLFSLGIQIGPFLPQQPRLTTQVATSDSQVEAPELNSELWRRLSINMQLTQRVGSILSSELPNVLNTQWNFGNGPITRLEVLNVSYQNPNGILSSIKLGKLMQAQDFTVNPIQCYFANFGLCGWAQGTPYMVPIPGNPFNSYGAVVEIGKANQTKLKYGIYQLAPSTFAPQYHGANFRFDQGIGTAHFLEVDIPLATPQLLPVVMDRPGSHIRSSRGAPANAYYQTDLPPSILTLGGWFGTGTFAKVNSPVAGATTEDNQSQNNGVYGIASMRLPLDAIALDNRLFISAGAGLNPSVQQFSSGGNAGLVLAGVLANRPFDTLSLGLAAAVYNPSFYLPDSQPGAYTPKTEIALEANYNIVLSGALSIMPNMQLILSPAGNSSRPAVAVAGLQVLLSF